MSDYVIAKVVVYTLLLPIWIPKKKTSENTKKQQNVNHTAITGAQDMAKKIL